jgi:hypothetical protein
MNASRKSGVGSIAAIALVTCGGCAAEDAPGAAAVPADEAATREERPPER